MTHTSHHQSPLLCKNPEDIRIMGMVTFSNSKNGKEFVTGSSSRKRPTRTFQPIQSGLCCGYRSTYCKKKLKQSHVISKRDEAPQESRTCVLLNSQTSSDDESILVEPGTPRPTCGPSSTKAQVGNDDLSSADVACTSCGNWSCQSKLDVGYMCDSCSCNKSDGPSASSHVQPRLKSRNNGHVTSHKFHKEAVIGVPSVIQSSVQSKEKHMSNLNNMLGDIHGYIDAEIKCGLCHEVLVDCLMLSCSHLFCFACIHFWFLRTGRKRCPECRAKAKRVTAAKVIDNYIKQIVANSSLQRREEREKLMSLYRTKATKAHKKCLKRGLGFNVREQNERLTLWRPLPGRKTNFGLEFVQSGQVCKLTTLLRDRMTGPVEQNDTIKATNSGSRAGFTQPKISNVTSSSGCVQRHAFTNDHVHPPQCSVMNGDCCGPTAIERAPQERMMGIPSSQHMQHHHHVHDVQNQAHGGLLSSIIGYFGKWFSSGTSASLEKMYAMPHHNQGIILCSHKNNYLVDDGDSCTPTSQATRNYAPIMQTNKSMELTVPNSYNNIPAFNPEPWHHH